jgi:hypothetical protein
LIKFLREEEEEEVVVVDFVHGWGDDERMKKVIWFLWMNRAVPVATKKMCGALHFSNFLFLAQFFFLTCLPSFFFLFFPC